MPIAQHLQELHAQYARRPTLWITVGVAEKENVIQTVLLILIPHAQHAKPATPFDLVSAVRVGGQAHAILIVH